MPKVQGLSPQLDTWIHKPDSWKALLRLAQKEPKDGLAGGLAFSEPASVRCEPCPMLSGCLPNRPCRAPRPGGEKVLSAARDGARGSRGESAVRSLHGTGPAGRRSRGSVVVCVQSSAHLFCCVHALAAPELHGGSIASTTAIGRSLPYEKSRFREQIIPKISSG